MWYNSSITNERGITNEMLKMQCRNETVTSLIGILEYTEKNTIQEMDMLLDKILIIHTAYMNAPECGYMELSSKYCENEDI